MNVCINFAMNPKTWGRYFWRVIHITALGYPEDPNEEDKQNYKNFFKNLGNVLPCKKCVANYYRHWDDIPIDLFLSNQNELFKWTIHLHNIVNKELGKVQWSLEFATYYYNTLIDRRSLEIKQQEIVQKTQENDHQYQQWYLEKKAQARRSFIQIFFILFNLVVIILTFIVLMKLT